MVTLSCKCITKEKKNPISSYNWFLVELGFPVVVPKEACPCPHTSQHFINDFDDRISNI